MILAALTTLTLTLPLLYENNDPLPLLIPLGINVYDRTGEIIATDFGFPGADLSIDLGSVCGGFTATAWIISSGLESPPAGPAIKPCGCFGSCHTGE